MSYNVSTENIIFNNSFELFLNNIRNGSTLFEKLTSLLKDAVDTVDTTNIKDIVETIDHYFSHLHELESETNVILWKDGDTVFEVDSRFMKRGQNQLDLKQFAGVNPLSFTTWSGISADAHGQRLLIRMMCQTLAYHSPALMSCLLSYLEEMRNTIAEKAIVMCAFTIKYWDFKKSLIQHAKLRLPFPEGFSDKQNMVHLYGFATLMQYAPMVQHTNIRELYKFNSNNTYDGEFISAVVWKRAHEIAQAGCIPEHDTLTAATLSKSV